MPIKILFLSLEGLKPGTAAHTHVEAVADGTKQCGHETSIIADGRHDYTSATLLNRFIRYIRLSNKVWKQRNQVDVVYIRSHFAASPLATALQLTGHPVVVEVNGLAGDMATTHSWLRPALRFLSLSEKRLFDAASQIICVTDDLTNRVRSKTATPANTVPNGVDTDKFIPSETGVPPYALFFGSLASWHGIPTLLEAFDDAAWPPDLKLVIAGRGKLSTTIQEIADINPQLDYRGYVAPAEMPKLVAGASLGLSPLELPRERGLTAVAPLKLVEMLSCGLPIVASHIEGQIELVEQAGGRTVSSGDATAFAQAVRDFWADGPALESARTKARAAALPYDWLSICRSIDTLAIQPALLASRKDT